KSGLRLFGRCGGDVRVGSSLASPAASPAARVETPLARLQQASRHRRESSPLPDSAPARLTWGKSTLPPSLFLFSLRKDAPCLPYRFARPRMIPRLSTTRTHSPTGDLTPIPQSRGFTSQTTAAAT